MKKLLLYAFVFIFVFFFGLRMAFVMGYEIKFPSGTDSMGDEAAKQWDYVNRNESPKIGDVVMYNCRTEECRHILNAKMRIIHRLTAISPTGCMTIIGDNQKYDWSVVPCFMPSDIEIVGVVHKLF